MAEIELNEDILQEESTRPLTFKEQLSVNNKKSSYYIENYPQIEKEVLTKNHTKGSNKQIYSQVLHNSITSGLSSLTFKMAEEMEKNNGQRNLELEGQILDLLQELQVVELLNLDGSMYNGAYEAYKKVYESIDEKRLDKKENQIEVLALRRNTLEKFAEYTPVASLATESIFKVVDEMEKNNGLRDLESEIKLSDSLQYVR